MAVALPLGRTGYSRNQGIRTWNSLQRPRRGALSFSAKIKTGSAARLTDAELFEAGALSALLYPFLKLGEWFLAAGWELSEPGNSEERASGHRPGELTDLLGQFSTLAS